MAHQQNARTIGDRVEAILTDLSGSGDPRVVGAAEELVHLLVDLYGSGLARVMAIAAENDPQLPVRLAEDPLVESLLLVHDLHPVDVDTRIQRALDRVRPYLGSHAGGVQYQGVDDAGVVHLTLEGSCHGCPSSTVTVRLAIERAVQEAAPETAGVEVEGQVPEPVGPPLLQIGRRPPAPSTPRAVPSTGLDDDGWARIRLPDGPGTHPLTVAGVPVLVCALDDNLYAYRDGCAECGAPLSAGILTDHVLSCRDCARTYDVRLAGAGLSDPTRHLEPLPLLADAAGVRIAVVAGAAR